MDEDIYAVVLQTLLFLRHISMGCLVGGIVSWDPEMLFCWGCSIAILTLWVIGEASPREVGLSNINIRGSNGQASGESGCAPRSWENTAFCHLRACGRVLSCWNESVCKQNELVAHLCVYFPSAPSESLLKSFRAWGHLGFRELSRVGAHAWFRALKTIKLPSCPKSIVVGTVPREITPKGRWIWGGTVGQPVRTQRDGLHRPSLVY